MKNVLVCWFNVPEEAFFVSVNVDEKDYEMLKGFHGKYVNVAGNSEELNDNITNFFYTKEGVFKFTKLKMPIVPTGTDLIIQTGFVL